MKTTMLKMTLLLAVVYFTSPLNPPLAQCRCPRIDTPWRSGGTWILALRGGEDSEKGPETLDDNIVPSSLGLDVSKNISPEDLTSPKFEDLGKNAKSGRRKPLYRYHNNTFQTLSSSGDEWEIVACDDGLDTNLSAFHDEMQELKAKYKEPGIAEEAVRTLRMRLREVVMKEEFGETLENEWHRTRPPYRGRGRGRGVVPQRGRGGYASRGRFSENAELEDTLAMMDSMRTGSTRRPASPYRSRYGGQAHRTDVVSAMGGKENICLVS